jgi:cubilin
LRDVLHIKGDKQESSKLRHVLYINDEAVGVLTLVLLDCTVYGSLRKNDTASRSESVYTWHFSRMAILVLLVAATIIYMPIAVSQSLCGSVFLLASSSVKYITTPNYPSNYPSYSNCRWMITTASPSEMVTLKVLNFTLEGHETGCPNDYVTIYDGSSTNFPRIKTWCGRYSRIQQFRSTGSSLSVVFYSDRSVEYAGFKIEYTSMKRSDVTHQCSGNTLLPYESSKYITSPNYPNNYSSNTNCEWHIAAASSLQVVSLKVLNLRLENSSTCGFDNLTIYNGSSTSSAKIQTMCGQVSSTQPLITSSGSFMVVEFRTDGSVNMMGFKLEYSFQNKPVVLAKCTNGTGLASGSSKYITSPNYPYNYSSSTYCRWDITATSMSQVVVLKLLDFSSRCGSDYVAIYDGSGTFGPKMQTLCGNVTDAPLFVTDGPFMSIDFRSDRSGNHRRFKFEFSFQEKQAKCTNGTLLASGIQNYITSPLYPSNYSSNTDCQWIITTMSTSDVVVLKLNDLYLEGSSPLCNSDYVSIYDGPSTRSSRIRQLCGQLSSPQQFTSTGSVVTVHFHSDLQRNYRGFIIEYFSRKYSGQCNNGTLLASGIPRYITSPHYPSNYLSNTKCLWHITAAAPSQVIVLKTEDVLMEQCAGCACDKLTFYDGSSTDGVMLQELCFANTSIQITSTGPAMTVAFRSDGSQERRGFNVRSTSQEKTSSCSGITLTANSTVNFLTSPSYPNQYPSDVYCQWHIYSGSPSSLIMLELRKLDVEGNQSNCIHDYVKIYDGPTTDSRLMTVLCGKILPRTFESSGSDLTVVFHSIGVNSQHLGFLFTYEAQELQTVWHGIEEHLNPNSACYTNPLVLYLAGATGCSLCVTLVLAIAVAFAWKRKKELSF